MYHDPRLENKYHAWILIRGFDVHPKEITRQIGLEPTDIEIKGEYRFVGKKKPHKMLNKENHWVLDSGLSREVSIEKQLEHLLNKIKPYKKNFTEISKKYELQLNCAIYYYEANPGINLDNNILKEITELNVGLGLDIYCLAGTISQFEYADSEKKLIKQLSQKKFISLLNDEKHNEVQALAESLIEIDKARQDLDMHLEDLVVFDDLTDEEYKVKFDRVTEDLRRIKKYINQSKYLKSVVDDSKK